MGIIYGDPASTSGYGWWQPVYIQGTAPVAVEAEIAVQTTDAVDYLTIGVMQGSQTRNLPAFLNGAKVLQAESGTNVSADASDVADADDSGGSHVNVTFATPTLAERFRVVADSSLRGTFNVYWWGGTKLGVDWPTIHLRTGLASTDLNAVTWPEVEAKSSDETFFKGYKLGKVHIPSDGAQQPTLSVWAEGDSTAEMNSDFLALFPVDAGDSLTVIQDADGSSFDNETVKISENGDVYRLEGGLPARRASVEGQSSLWMNPGLNLLGIFGNETDPTGGLSAFKSDTYTIRLRYSPRYYS